MDFYMKLPRGKREFILFLVTLSIISMNIIAPLITCFEMGFSLNSWAHVFPIMPILWPCVIATVLVTYKPAAFLTSKLTQEGDSFHAVVTPMEPLVKPVGKSQFRSYFDKLFTASVKRSIA